jgi:TolA-binding protein
VGIRQYGLIAEEVAEVMPELVQFSAAGEAETVRCHFLAPLLLNELQKQQQRIEEQQRTIEELQTQQYLVAELQKENRDLEQRLRKLEAASAGAVSMASR